MRSPGNTTTKPTRAAGLCAVAAGLVFIGVQINLHANPGPRPTLGTDCPTTD